MRIWLTRRMKNKFLLILSCLLAWCSAAAKSDYADPYKDYDEAMFMDLDLESNLSLPEIPKSCVQRVTAYMNQVATDLAKQRYMVDLLRDDEVILVTIPTDELFLPNDTLLSPSAAGRLTPLMKLLKEPLMYKLMYAVHTDNTGSEYYNMQLSHKRNGSVYDYILDAVSEDQIVIPYEFGDTDPIESNESRQGRQANRRLEIFFVPGPRMIELAHKNMLH